MLEHNARINETKVVVREGLKIVVFIQQETTLRKIAVKFLRHFYHRGRDVHSAAFGKIFRQSPRQTAHTASEIESRRFPIDANPKFAETAQNDAHFIPAGGKKLLLRPPPVPLCG